jgi:hypothetical protein
MSAIEVIAEIKALPENERDRVLGFLIADAELREDLQDSIAIESRRHEPSRPLAEVLNDLGVKV